MAKRQQNKSRIDVEETVAVDLSNAELLDLGREHAASLNALDALNEGHKAVKKKLKLEAENAQEKERDLREAIATGKQNRPVACYRERDFDKGVAVIRRKDNDAVVRTEKLSDDERQTDLEDRTSKARANTDEPDDERA